MAKQFQLRRGTTAQHASFTGLVGEVTVDTDTDQLRIHDGSTAGGILQGPPLGSIIAVATGITNAYTLPSTGAVGVGGWMLCDGASIPGAATLSGNVPTLTDGRFLQGNTHANVGGTGGNTIPAHTHTGPSHTHTGPSHSHTVDNHTHSFGTNTTGNHSHDHYANNGWHPMRGGSGINGASFGGQRHSTGTEGNHSHSGTTNGSSPGTNSGGTGATGSAGTGATGSFGTGSDVLPKYLRVVYIIRVQ